MNEFYMLRPGRWTGLTETPVRPGLPGASPVLVTSVKALKTGLGQLEIGFVQPLHTGGGRQRTITAKVVQKTPSHLTCLFKEGGESRTAVLAQPDFDWLENCCSELLRRRPPAIPTFIIDGERIGAPSWEEHLARVFGNSLDEVMRGAHRKSFSVKPGRMPKERAQVVINKELEPLDSILVARGFKPQQMEDKWFIIHEKGRLLFWRSWTGILIYDLAACWRGDRLYLAQALVNRMPDQYGETDDTYDACLLEYLINALLRGIPTAFPEKRSQVPTTRQA